MIKTVFLACAFMFLGEHNQSIERIGHGRRAQAAVSGTLAPGRTVDEAQLICGRNSLYMFLRLYGCTVEYEDVEKLVYVGERGSSLRDMRDAAHALGVKTQVYHCKSSDFVNIETPFIAHINRKRVEDPIISEEAVPTGHFIVALNCDSGGVDFIDGSFGYSGRYTDAWFRQIWTGYLLMLKPVSYLWDLQLLALTGSFWAFLGWLVMKVAK